MKVTDRIPKTGEEFLVCYVNDNGNVISNVMKWFDEWDMFIGVDKEITLSSDKQEELFFEGTTILVSKGE